MLFNNLIAAKHGCGADQVGTWQQPLVEVDWRKRKHHSCEFDTTSPVEPDVQEPRSLISGTAGDCCVLYAGVAQLVERNLAMVEVVSSNLITRSNYSIFSCDVAW